MADSVLLIVNADDFGYFPCVSRGILDLASQGRVTATGVFANVPWLDEHLAWAAQVPQLDLGVHLNLTDGEPLSMGMRDAVGDRFGRKFAMARAVITGKVPLRVVEAEWRAQIDRCMDAGMQPTFLNAHEHMHMLPPLYRLVGRLAADYGIAHVRHSIPERSAVFAPGALLRDGIMWGLSLINRPRSPAPVFLGMGASGRLENDYLDRRLAGLKPGRVYELMCHPGACTCDDVSDSRLLDYHDWPLEQTALSSQAFADSCRRHNVQLVGYRDLRVTNGRLELQGECA